MPQACAPLRAMVEYFYEPKRPSQSAAAELLNTNRNQSIVASVNAMAISAICNLLQLQL